MVAIKTVQATLKYILFFITFIFITVSTYAAILPPDQADILYHQYNGDGLTIDGPSVLVRKGFKDKVSVWANHYADSISGASIDILSQGSEFYEESRDEQSIGVDYIHERSILSVSARQSNELDYNSKSFSVSVSQDFFGDMSTLSLSYGQGHNDVGRNIYVDGVISFTEEIGESDQQRFAIGLTQVLTRHWIVSLNAESISDNGFLNNPYRNVRFLSQTGTVSQQAERYPESRNSDAIAIKSIHYLPWHASTKFEMRYFTDSWGIRSYNVELRYTHPFNDRIQLETKARFYDQSSADFYSDLFPFIDAQNFLARDKELSTFTSTALGLGLSYEFDRNWISFIDKSSVHFFWDMIQFDYADFRTFLPEYTGNPEFGPGNEPLYNFNANAIRLFMTFKY